VIKNSKLKKMKLKGRITILVNSNSTTIEIMDESSRTRFVEIQLSPEQLSAALSRESMIECEMEVRGLENIGKKHEVRLVDFEIPKELAKSQYKDELNALLQSKLTDGWIACDSYTSRGSIYEKNGVFYAIATCRRYV